MSGWFWRQWYRWRRWHHKRALERHEMKVWLDITRPPFDE